MRAFGMGTPDESATVPLMVPVPCANTMDGARSSAMVDSISRHQTESLIWDMQASSCCWKRCAGAQMGRSIANVAMHSDAYVLKRNNTVIGDDPRDGFRNCRFVSKCSANRHGRRSGRP